jgi:methenyltetrahydrofolate cyclohydrolase
VVRTALLLVSLAEELLPAGNRNMVTDLAAAAVAARAAAVTARLFIEINLKGITEAVLLDEFGATAAVADTVVARADQLVMAVRAETSR